VCLILIIYLLRIIVRNNYLVSLHFCFPNYICSLIAHVIGQLFFPELELTWVSSCEGSLGRAVSEVQRDENWCVLLSLEPGAPGRGGRDTGPARALLPSLPRLLPRAAAGSRSAGIHHGPTASFEKAASNRVSISLWLCLLALILLLIHGCQAQPRREAAALRWGHPELPQRRAEPPSPSLLAPVAGGPVSRSTR